MSIDLVEADKKQYLSLLLLADEQEDMIDHYLEVGDFYVMKDDNEAVAVCVVTWEAAGILEIKNLAVRPDRQGQGLGKSMLSFIEEKYGQECSALQVGTGDSPLTVPFYEKCGFRYSHRKPGFFTENYDHPIYEAGVQLIDMVYLRKQ